MQSGLANLNQMADMGSANLYNVCSRDSYVNMAKHIINTKYNTPLTLSEIARKISITPTYLANIFKQSTGISVMQYLTHCRIDKAKRYLEDSDYNIIEISRLVGYSSPKYFIMVFKKATGITPKTYRYLIRNIACRHSI